MYDIAVIGGGAAGLMAALHAKRLAPGAQIVVLERLARVGKKLIATGNGRCNLTNLGACERDYHGGTALMAEAMRRFAPTTVIKIFQSIGVEPLYEGDKVYPLSEQASSVLDALRLSLDELGVEIMCEFDARSISPGFAIAAGDGRELRARRVILAAGSMCAPNLGGTDSGYRLLRALGHRITELNPALVQLRTEIEPIKPLTGIKYEGAVSILVDGQVRRTERGEVLFTDYGLSGPPVLQLSRIAAIALQRRKRVQLALHIFDEPPLALLKSRRAALAKRQLGDFLSGMLNKRLGQTLLKLAGCAPLGREAGTLGDFELEALAGLMANWPLEVTGTQGYRSAQVTSGGADTREFDPKTLESRVCPGLHVIGELLDIDGDCGGYNLQWAWASALLAAESAAGELA